jgi:hypothetical protein
MSEKPKQADIELMHRVISGALRPRAPEIAVMGFTGHVVVAVFELGERAREEALAIGWDGKSAVFALSEEGRKVLLGSSLVESPTAKWLRKKFEASSPVARIYVLTGETALLVNYSAFGGWSLEPASGDAGPPN